MQWISILTVKAERMCIKLANEYNREFKAGHQSHLVDETPLFLITKKCDIYASYGSQNTLIVICYTTMSDSSTK